MNHTEGLGRRSSRETECWLPPGQHVVGYCRALDTMDMDEAEKYDDSCYMILILIIMMMIMWTMMTIYCISCRLFGTNPFVFAYGHDVDFDGH